MKQYTQDKKYYSIECLRFVFAICIIYFHLLHSFIMPYTDDSAVYKTLAVDARYMKYIVECFFIISGYFLYQSIQRHPDRSFREFFRAKIARLWPVLACSICISMVLGKKSFTTSFLNLFFLQSSGIVSDWSGLNWYVSAFFIAEVFYFVLYKCFHNSAVMKLLILLLVCGGYAVNLFFMSGGFGRKMVYGVLNLGLARGIAGVGWGYMLGMMFEFLKNMYRKLPEKESCSQIAELGISVIEISAALMLAVNFFYSKEAFRNQIIVVVLFTALFICFLTRRGILSLLMDHPFWGILGKYTYSMYVMQETAFVILQHTFWKNTTYIQMHPIIAIMLSIISATILGITAYYFIERPGAIVMKRILF